MFSLIGSALSYTQMKNQEILCQYNNCKRVRHFTIKSQVDRYAYVYRCARSACKHYILPWATWKGAPSSSLWQKREFACTELLRKLLVTFHISFISASQAIPTAHRHLRLQSDPIRVKFLYSDWLVYVEGSQSEIQYSFISSCTTHTYKWFG